MSHTLTVVEQATTVVEGENVAAVAVAETSVSVSIAEFDVSVDVTSGIHGDELHNTTVASLVSGKVPTSELGAGSAGSTTFLRGDQSWQVPAGGGGGGAPTDANYVTTTANGTLSDEVLLSAVNGRGTLAARPAAGMAGRMYYVTDSGSERWTRDTGSAWEDASPSMNQLVAPTTSVSLNSQRIIGLATPIAATDAATKAYADAIVSGLDVKLSVRAATTAAGTLATSFENGDTIDGVALVTGDRILIKNQAAGAENGIYTVNASGAPTRATDADTTGEVNAGMFTFVEAGTTQQDMGWVLATNNPITLGTTALVFTQFSGVGSGLPLTGGTLTGLLTIGSGDAVTMYNATSAQWLAVKKGTAGSPDATVNPLLKVERTLQVVSGGFSGDGVENCSAIAGIGVGTATNDGQVVGTAGLAKSASTTVGSSGGDDACGLYGVGRITGAGTGTGIGAFLNGRRDTNTGKACGLEAVADNETATADSYLSTGFSSTSGIWLHALGTARSAVGLAIGNPGSAQLDVGIGITSQGTGGPILTTSIRDDSSSINSLLINGTHTRAIGIKTGSGVISIGHTNADDALTNATALIEAFTSASADPLIVAQGNGSVGVTIKVGNSSGSGRYFVAAGTNYILTGTAVGDTGLAASTSGKKLHLGGTSSVIAVTQDNKLGFFNVTPVVQSATYAVTNVTTDRTYDANVPTLNEVADVLGTLITDLKGIGLIG